MLVILVQASITFKIYSHSIFHYKYHKTQHMYRWI